MVALDLTEMDDQLLQVANDLINPLEVKQLTAGHVVPVLTVAGMFKFAVGEILTPVAPALGKVEEYLRHKTNTWIDRQAGVRIYTRFVEGRPYEELLKLLEDTPIDLLIMGKKKVSTKSGITAKRVARHTESDLLFIPENGLKEIKKILVAIDFSEYSARAIARAVSLAKGLEYPGVVESVFVKDMLLPMSVINRGEYTNLEEESQLEMEELFADFLLKYKIDSKNVQGSFIKTGANNIAKTIHTYASDQNVDLIVMGAKGHSFGERFLMGSVTEAMVDSDFEIPIYIVR